MERKMKKLTALFIVLYITASLFALEEVRGVQTRKTKDSNYYDFEFVNENDFSVSVEAELYHTCGKPARVVVLRDTKNFNLKIGETYRWKTDVYYSCSPYVKYKAYKLNADDSKKK